MFKQQILKDMMKTVIGCMLFGLSFNLFLIPNGLNAGGLSGLSMTIDHLLNVGSVGLLTALLNVPVFLLGARKLGKRFFLGSLFGMITSSVMIDLLSVMPPIHAEPLLGALYGGALCGAGMGLVFSAGMTTGGSDIVVRLLKRRWRDIPIGKISICFDFFVAVLTGIVFRDVTKTLYSGVAVVTTGMIVDAVVYRFDYSRVALIISRHHKRIAERIGVELDRGATFLDAQGSFTGSEMKVVLTAVRRQQLAQLKQLVTDVDPDAFIIVQEAHQVLGDGFVRFTTDAL